jgi:plasmid stability protein
MASITIRNLDPRTKARLRVRAAQHDRSMEEEAREILREAVASEGRAELNLAEAIRKRFAPFGGVELEIPKRTRGRPPPDFK